MQNLLDIAEYLQTICTECSGGGSGQLLHFVEKHPALSSGNTVSCAAYLTGDIVAVYRNGDYKSVDIDYTQSGNIFTFTFPFGNSGGANPEGEIVTFEILRP